MRRVLSLALAAVALAVPALADEGMWLPNRLPNAYLKKTYGFEADSQWLEHVQKTAVRFSTGGSGSIVSPEGLVMTNHHVASDMLAKLSTPERDLLDVGFHATEPAEELQCPDLELMVLWEIEDVTDRVKGAATADMNAAQANTARRQMMSTIEKESKDSTNLHSEVVTLYQGGRYHLYRYQRYTDVRLVFAPEQEAAFFGGDTDNFEYPRYCLDVAFFRIYENGQPLQPDHYLDWSAAGSNDGDLAFVVGHPGSTRRLYTTDHLAFLRDVEQVGALNRLWRAEVKLQEFSGRSAENERIAKDMLFGVANGRKARTGRLAGLLDPALMDRKAADERALREAVNANPQWKKDWGDAWDQIAEAQRIHNEFYERRAAIGVSSDLFGKALTILRLAEELPKPSAERLREYRDSNLESVYLDLYSPAPIYDNFEIFRIESSLSYMAESLGADDPLVRAALAGKSPRDRAAELVQGTRLGDVAVRRTLAEGGTAAIAAANDPMIELARALDAESRSLRQRYEDEVESRQRDGYAKIAAAKFAVQGESVYPDATFTLRISYGPVAGWEEAGEMVPAFTQFGGLYERWTQRGGTGEFSLPERFIERKDKLDLSTPYNFVFKGDIIGGNSGSPVLNRAGEVIGLVFDGNIHSLPGDMIYDERVNRAVAVDSRAIIEALGALYDAEHLVAELTKR